MSRKVKVVVGSSSHSGDFIGVGYHAFFPIHHRQTTPEVESVLHERWRDLAPSFARVTHYWTWDVEHVARQIAMMRSTGTSVYLTTWDPENLATEAERDAYARRVADLLYDLVIVRKLDNVRWYCMTNELSMPDTGWGSLYKDLPTFADYHHRIRTALDVRGVNVGLLASDASPVSRWDSIAWAAQHMDAVTAAYGGHNYLNDHDPDDVDFYGWFRDEVARSSTVSHDLGKPFIIGEFGPRQHHGERYGFERWDGCAWFDTPQEAMAAVQTVEAAMAAIEGGADAVAYWTFADFPDDWGAHGRNANKWGTFRWDADFSRRPVYYAFGLLSRFLRGPGTVYPVSVDDPLVRAVAVGGGEPVRCTMVLVNRNGHAIDVHADFGDEFSAGKFDVYLFDPAAAAGYGKDDALLNSRNTLGKAGPPRARVPPMSVVVMTESR